MRPRNLSALAWSRTSCSLFPTRSGAGGWSSDGLVGAILTYRPSTSSTRMRSLIAENSAWSSASDSRSGVTGVCEGVVMPGPQYSPDPPQGATAGPWDGPDRDHATPPLGPRARSRQARPSGRLGRRGFVQDQPVEAELADPVRNPAEPNRPDRHYTPLNNKPPPTKATLFCMTKNSNPIT